MTVKEARSGDMVRAGQVLIAPGGEKHLHLVKMNVIFLKEYVIPILN